MGISTYITKVKLSAELRSWIDEYSKIYENTMREELKISITNNIPISDEKILEINKEMYNFFFYKTTQMINNSNSSHVQLRWSLLSTQKYIGFAEIDFNNFTIGMAYLCLFYCFTNREPNTTNINECLELNHINRFSLQNVLHKLEDEFNETIYTKDMPSKSSTPPIKENQKHIYCNYCGTKNNINRTNCYMCGKELM